MFYAFLVALAERFDRAKKKVYIDRPIRYLAFVQLAFVVSAILVLFDQPVWALGLAVFGLFMLSTYSLLMIYDRGLIEGR